MADTFEIKREFEIPKKVVPVVIGPKGANVQRIQKTSGCRVAVDFKTNRVKLSATSQGSLEEAERQILKISANATQSVASNFDHPCLAIVQVGPEFVSGCRFSKDSSVSNERYVLRSSSLSESENCDSSGELVFVKDSASVGDDGFPKVFYPFDQSEKVYLLYASQASADVALRAGTIRFAFGKQLFYDPPRGKKITPDLHLTLSALGNLRVGFDKDLKAEFENGISLRTLERFRERLLAQGFSKSPGKTSLSCHVFDMEEQSGLLCRFVPDKNTIFGSGEFQRNLPDSVASAPTTGSVSDHANSAVIYRIERVKTAKNRLCFVSFLHDRDHLDYRFKLLAHKNSEADADVRSACPVIKWDEASSTAEFLRSKEWNEAATKKIYGDRFLLEAARLKSKDIYQGTVHGYNFRISLTKVQDPRGMHYEVTGTNLDWKASNIADRDAYFATCSLCERLIES